MAKDILKQLDEIQRSDIHAKEWMQKDLANLKAHMKANPATAPSKPPVQGLSSFAIAGVVLVAAFLIFTIFTGGDIDPNQTPTPTVDASSTPSQTQDPDGSETPTATPTNDPDGTKTPTPTPDDKEEPTPTPDDHGNGGDTDTPTPTPDNTKDPDDPTPTPTDQSDPKF